MSRFDPYSKPKLFERYFVEDSVSSENELCCSGRVNTRRSQKDLIQNLKKFSKTFIMNISVQNFPMVTWLGPKKCNFNLFTCKNFNKKKNFLLTLREFKKGFMRYFLTFEN